MTNIELIKILQKSVKKFGELPVDMNIIDYDDSDKPYDIKAALYDDNSVTLFNYQNMTREEAKELLPLIQGYAEGKTIQFLKIDGTWRDMTEPNFSSPANSYRIKPEPKYRPFKDAEECWKEMQKHQPFGWLSNGGLLFNIISIGAGITIHNCISNCGYSFKSAVSLTFADGTPFGILEEE